MYIVYGSSSSNRASTAALSILSIGSESTKDLFSSLRIALWISDHLPDLKFLDWAKLTVHRSAAANNNVVFLIAQK